MHRFSAHLIFCLSLLSALAAPTMAELSPTETAVKAVHETYRGLQSETLYARVLANKTFREITLVQVSSAEVQPSPRWIVAVGRRIGTPIVLSPSNTDGWNRLVELQPLTLKDTKSLSQFPDFFLALVSPMHQPRRQVARDEFASLSPAAIEHIRQGWHVKRKQDNLELHFFSEALDGRLVLWRVIVDRRGKVYSSSQEFLESIS